MTDAFRIGRGVLTPEGEQPLRISFIGYTVGSDTVYFEALST